jgi:hypothetical protein
MAETGVTVAAATGVTRPRSSGEKGRLYPGKPRALKRGWSEKALSIRWLQDIWRAMALISQFWCCFCSFCSDTADAGTDRLRLIQPVRESVKPERRHACRDI